VESLGACERAKYRERKRGGSLREGKRRGEEI